MMIAKYRERKTFSAGMKIADLIDFNYNLLTVLSRLGIGLGFGEDRIGEICSRNGINVDSFLLICYIYSYDDYIPSSEMISRADPADIVKYLHNSHLKYMKDDMESLEKNLNEMVEPCSWKHKSLISGFFAGYKQEVLKHFAYEEDTVFPYVTGLVSGNIEGEISYSIEKFEENHSNIDEKLNDLKNIVMKYLPETCDNVLRNEVLYHLYSLEKDLDIHTVLENSVLIPLVNRLEHDERK